jgi:limonene-1,2-epoxide hydrolase
MPDPVEVVRQFCALMEKRDPEALRPFLASGAVYQNVGMPAFTGVEAILENMGAQFSMFPDAYAFEIVNIASEGSVVLTERLDYIQAPDGAKPAVPVMGTFVLDESGKITRWTDYFDVSLTVKLLQGEDISALGPRGLDLGCGALQYRMSRPVGGAAGGGSANGASPGEMRPSTCGPVSSGTWCQARNPISAIR